MTAYDLVEWKCHLEGEILTGGNRQVTSKCPRVEIDECLGWNMTRGAGWRRARQQKAGQSLESELELSCGAKSVCMQSFNNVNPSCILIQIELDQLGRENWGESVRECESVMLHSEPKERQKNARKKEKKNLLIWPMTMAPMKTIWTFHQEISWSGCLAFTFVLQCIWTML